MLFLTRFDMMALGGLFAYGVFFRHILLTRFLASPVVAWGAASYIVLLLVVEVDPLLLALGFAILIGHFALKGRRIGWLAPLRHGGEISYGLYMYHPVVLYFTMSAVLALGRHSWSPWLMNVLFYAAGIGGSWLVAWCSYHYFEKPFLRLKKVLEKVKTAKEAM